MNSDNEFLNTLPTFLKPKLRLFLSVDIVNSTAFKQATAKDRKALKHDQAGDEPAEPWFSPISRFYREIERLFSATWTHQSRAAEDGFNWHKGDPPELWKAAGDELLYVKTLSDYREALVTVRAWIEAINQHRSVIKSQYSMLDLKATAWLAGFPVNNAEVILRPSISVPGDDLAEGDPILSNLLLLKNYYDQRSSEFRDFIGPSVDTGFRVATLASARKMAITVDLALLLAHATVNQPNDEHFPFQKLQFHYDGRVPLKGVFDGSDYPFFWIDTANGDALIEIEDTISRVEPIGANEVKEFCERFIAKSGGHVIKPFILGCKDPLFREVPNYHLDRLKKLADYWEKESAKRETERKALGGESPDAGDKEKNLDPDEAEKVTSMLPHTSGASKTITVNPVNQEASS